MNHIKLPFYLITIAYICFGCSKEENPCHGNPSDSIFWKKEIETRHDLRTGISSTVKYSYDDKGRITRFSSGRVEQYGYRYDNLGNPIYYETDMNGTIVISTFLNYKKPLTIIYISRSWYPAIRNDSTIEEFSYNESEYLTGFKRFQNGKLSNENLNYEHDEYGNAIYFETINTGTTSNSTTTSSFLAYEKPLKVIFQGDSSWLTFVHEYKYDEHERLINYKMTDPSGIIIEDNNFQYDEFGNNVSFESFQGGNHTSNYRTSYKCFKK